MQRIILIVLILLCTCGSYAVEYGSVRQSDVSIDYSKIDITGRREKADKSFNLAMKEKDSKKKKQYFHDALVEYSVISRVKLDDIHSIVQMGRIYDYNKNNRYAQSYFSRALMIDSKNVEANYYFGDYYNSRKDYKNAAHYYNLAMASGAKETYDTCLKLGIIYEKIGDLNRANIYYKKAYLQNPKNDKLANKIKNLESIKYTNSKYYKKRK